MEVHQACVCFHCIYRTAGFLAGPKPNVNLSTSVIQYATFEHSSHSNTGPSSHSGNEHHHQLVWLSAFWMACRNSTPFLTGFNLLRSSITMEEKLTRLSLAVMGARLSKLYELNIWAITLGRPREEWMVVATDSQAASPAPGLVPPARPPRRYVHPSARRAFPSLALTLVSAGMD